MARRTVNAGINEDVIRSLGVAPWDERARPTQPLYVKSRYSDDPLGTQLWVDIRKAYYRHHINPTSQTMFELVLDGLSYREVAALFKRKSPRSVQYRVERVETILLNDPKLGLITSIYESCGGWRAVGEYMRW